MEERLRKFAAVVDAGSFTAAAQELHVSQPALSAAIHKLERELKAPLLVRGVRPLCLTPAGEHAYATAKELAVSAENLHVRLAELARADIRLRLGMIDSIAGTVFGGAATLAGRHVQLAVTVNNSRFLLRAVERDEIDAALVARQPEPVSPLLEVRHLADEPLVVACHRQIGNRVQKQLKRQVLEGFMSYDQQSTTYGLVHAVLQARGIAVRTDFYSTSPEVMLGMVVSRQGVAALPYRMVVPYVRAGELTMVGSPHPWIIARGIMLARRRDRQMAAPVARLERQVRRALEALMAEAAAFPSSRP